LLNTSFDESRKMAMNHKDLPERWTDKLKAYLREELGVNRETLSAEDFKHSLKINTIKDDDSVRRKCLMPPRTALGKNERELYSKIRRLLNEPGLLRGTLVEVKRRCGKRNCRCHTEVDSRHRALALGISLNGKYQMIHIPAEWEERVRRWTERYSQLRGLLEQISLKSLERLQQRKE